MNEDQCTFEILVVDDDQENIDQLKQLLPDTVGENPIAWEYTVSFDDALSTLKRRRFDVLISDIYRGREKGQKTISEGDVRARELVDEIRQRHHQSEEPEPPSICAAQCLKISDDGHSGTTSRKSARRTCI